MATKKEKVWAGLFLVGAVALLVGAVAFIKNLGHSEPHPYEIHFPPRSSVAGLAVGNKVRFKGVPIGKVGEIRLADEGYAMATILINQEDVRHLDAGVRAVLTFDGITGSKSIDLKQVDRATAPRQTAADERWANDGLLAETGVFDTLLDEGPAVIDDVQGLLGRVQLLVIRADRFLDRSEERFDEFLRSLDMLAAEGAPRLIQLIDRTDRTLAAAERRLLAEGGTLDRVEESFDRHLGRLVDEVAITAADVARDADRVATEVSTSLAETRDPTIETLDAARVTLADIRRLVAELRGVVDANRATFGAMVAELRDASESIERTMETIRRDPNALIFGREDEGSQP